MRKMRLLANAGIGLLIACQTGIVWAKSEWDMVPDGAVMTEPYNADKTDLYGLPDKASPPPGYAAESKPSLPPSLMEEEPTESLETEEFPLKYPESIGTESAEAPSYDWKAEDLERLGRPLTPEEEQQFKDLMAASNPS